MSEIDRKIAERLGWRIAVGEKALWVLWRPNENGVPFAVATVSEDEAWKAALNEFGGRWSQDIAAALALVEELGILLHIMSFPNETAAENRWAASFRTTWDSSAPYQLASTPAEAVAAAILAWLEAKNEEGRGHDE